LDTAELHRIRGELPRQSGDPSQDAGRCFWRAIEIARARQQKLLELRAVTSLGRLLEQQGKSGEARRLLADIYGWFSEGFETRDLKEAKALLHDLA